MSVKCTVQKAIETLTVLEIQYDGNDGSSFIPNLSKEDMCLQIKINTNGAFLKDTKLVLKMIGYKDPEYGIHYIDPIISKIIIKETTNSLLFKFKNSAIPIPFGVSYLKLLEEHDDEPNVGLHIGSVQEYLFVLYVKCNKCKVKHVVPLTVRYIGNDPITDYKCEKPEQVEETEGTIPVLWNGQTIYYKKPFCVSHGQMKRPRLLSYSL